MVIILFALNSKIYCILNHMTSIVYVIDFLIIFYRQLLSLILIFLRRY